MIEEDDIEFDIQKTILRKKENKNSQFYVEYDRLTNQVFGITPDNIKPKNIRHDLLAVDDVELVKSIFENKVSLHKFRVRYDHVSGQRILYKQNDRRRGEFDYIRGSNSTEDNFIHLYCDIVSKKINVNFVENVFLSEFTKERVSEVTLGELPSHMPVYAIDKFEPSKLFDTINIDFRKLFQGHEQRFRCWWLPNDPGQLDSIDFLHYNHHVAIYVDRDPLYVPASKKSYKPAILYKQQGNRLYIQSMISETKNFYLDSDITFYLFDASDPSQILDAITVNSSVLNNFNLVEFKIKTTKKIKMISNYSHLPIEDANVSTYYQF